MAPRGYVTEQQVIEIARRVASGEITEAEALAELDRLAGLTTR